MSMTTHICMGDGMVAVAIHNHLLTFTTENEYGKITIEKEIPATGTDIIHRYIIARHFRCMTHLQHIRSIHLLIAKQPRVEYSIAIVANTAYTVWFHSHPQSAN